MAKKPKKGEESPKEDTLSIDGEPTAGSEEAAQQGPMLSVLAQYTKDQSFENPGAPNSLRSGLPAPQIGVNIDLKQKRGAKTTSPLSPSSNMQGSSPFRASI